MNRNQFLEIFFPDVCLKEYHQKILLAKFGKPGFRAVFSIPLFVVVADHFAGYVMQQQLPLVFLYQ